MDRTLTQDNGRGGCGEKDGHKVLLKAVSLEASKLLLEGLEQSSCPVDKRLHRTFDAPELSIDQ